MCSEMLRLDDNKAIKLDDGLWWVGFADFEAGFSNNPYLLVDGDEAVLFDPGPGHPFFKYLIMEKLEQVIDLARIKYVVVHHQDPDLVGLLPLLEGSLHPEVVVITHPRTGLFVPYYGTRSPILPVQDDDVLELESGRRIRFVHLPYLHFAGNMASFDEQTGTLFSSDLFGGFNRSWQLYSDADHLPMARAFVEEYVGDRRCLEYAHRKLSHLPLRRICPQHGGIIEDDCQLFVDMLLEAEPGRGMDPPQPPGAAAQLQALVVTVRERLSKATGRDYFGESIEALVREATSQTFVDLTTLSSVVQEEAGKLGIADPMPRRTIHRRDNIRTIETGRVIDSLQRRLMLRHMSVGEGDSDENRRQLGRGLLSIVQKMAILFVDIRQFMLWCDGRAPDDIVRYLSHQLELQARVIHRHGGRVNKVLGDGLLAFFPERKAAECVSAAIELQNRVTEEGLLPIGVGCSFGEVLLGDLGEETRLDFTLIGTPVNRASRICDAASPGQVCLDDELAGVLPADFILHLRERCAPESFEVMGKPYDPPRQGLRLFVEGCVEK